METFFEVLGVPRAMRLDAQQLDRAYREVSKQTHPDRAEAAERRAALDRTVIVNDAYRTLKDPQRRAEYLMSLEGVDVASERNTTSNKPLLMEMLELQEELESTHGSDALDALRARMLGRKKKLLEGLAAYFDDSSGEKEDAVDHLIELRYVDRLLQGIDQKLEAHE
jgi:molecular chaperone HscB